ncbi:MAG: hypothetical protein IJ422_06120 [Oscillospiraceae bacterium]|nr:hypothetical protein [Oscillospiraceae bacterium]
MIFNQRKIPRDKWRYGFRSSAATGCGWIAVYNALRLLRYHAEPEGLIRYFERQLPLIHGNVGTTLFGPVLYFIRWGFPVKMAWRRSKFDGLAKESDACILFFRWRRGLRFGAHFVALEDTDRGFVGYNTYRSSEGPDFYGESLDAFLKKRGYFCAVLIGIRDKRG